MEGRWTRGAALAGLTLLAGGCINGPARYSALGDWRYGTYEYPADSHMP